MGQSNSQSGASQSNRNNLVPVKVFDPTQTSTLFAVPGPYDPLQQDGQNHRLLLHPVPALFGLLGKFFFCFLFPLRRFIVSRWASEKRCKLFFFTLDLSRCCTRRLGARVSAETALRSVLRSELASCCLRRLKLLFWCSYCKLKTHFSAQVRRPPPPLP